MEKHCLCTESNVYVRKNQLTLKNFVGVEIEDFQWPQVWKVAVFEYRVMKSIIPTINIKKSPNFRRK
jgi:hypothetical protein